MRRNWHNIEGRRFGKLVAVKIAGIQRGGTCLTWLCRCDCGNSRTVPSTMLTKNRATSCLEELPPRAQTHGLSRSPEYRAHRAMLDRCYSPAVDAYPDYGGRGITVCDSWRGPHGFEQFFADMGKRPEGTSLDREKVNGIYEPGNCRWATRSQQSKNRRKFVALTNHPTIAIFNELPRRCAGVVS